MAKRRLTRNVRRRIVLKVGGRVVKTVRDRITEAAAARELGRELVSVGHEEWLRRKVGRSVRVEIGYTLLCLPDVTSIVRVTIDPRVCKGGQVTL
jgi:hypothetical protein